MRRVDIVTESSILAVLVVVASTLGQSQHAPYKPVIDPKNFTRKIDNPYYPLKPGTVYTYKGVTDAGQELNTVEVTHSTRVLIGVTCVEVIDTVFLESVLEELTHEWLRKTSRVMFGTLAKIPGNSPTASK